MEGTETRRIIVLFPFPLQGHLNPMLQLANILYEKGFSITVIHTRFNSLNSSNYPLFTFVPISDGLSEKEASNPDVIEFLHDLNSRCVGPFRDCLAKLLSKDRAVCLIVDAHWYFTEAVTSKIEIPRMVLRTSNLSSFILFAEFHVLRQKGYLPLQESQAESPVPEFPYLKMKDLPWIPTCDPKSLDKLLSSATKAMKASSGIIFNTIEEVEPHSLDQIRKEFQVPVFCVGPFHRYILASSSSLLTEDRTCISWLDKQAPNSVIYVSFGSIASINESEFLEIAWGLSNSKQPFLWVVRPGLVRGAEWLELLPEEFIKNLNEKGKIVKWAPQLEVLAHPAVGGFWTHNGWNSTLESICQGVPMICHPFFGDQRVNARYISDVWRIGLHLEYKLERGEIEKAIKRLMTDLKGKEIRERITQLKEIAERCLKQGGSSYQSLENLICYMLSF